MFGLTVDLVVSVNFFKLAQDWNLYYFLVFGLFFMLNGFGGQIRQL